MVRRRSCEESYSTDVMMYQACFPAADVFSDSLFFFLSLLDLCQELKFTRFMVYRRNRAAPTGRGKSSVCQMMSVFGEDECDDGGGGIDESGKRRVCVEEATSNPPKRCETSLQTERERERGRELFTRLKGKRIPLLICVQSKNNFPFLSTAHWGRLVKESVSEEGASKSCRGPNKMKSQSEREGLKWKMCTRGKAHRVTAKTGRARVTLQEIDIELIKLNRWESFKATPIRQLDTIQRSYTSSVFDPKVFVSVGAAVKAPGAR